MHIDVLRQRIRFSSSKRRGRPSCDGAPFVW